jgi:SAM-dependent methyltransferase
MPLHTDNPTARFSDRAADYVKFRPTYPSAAIDAILQGLGDRSQLTAADIGAGTGISARLLAARGIRVIAIEPNAAMRSAAEPHPLIEVRDGAAEATGLPESSLDLVLCAQAFHWFRPEPALAEFRRILRPSGRLALMWNDRDPADAATAAYGRAVILASGHDPAANPRVTPDPLFRSRLFRNTRELIFPNHQTLDLQGLIGRALSASYIPRSGPAHDGLMADLRSLHEARADTHGLVRLIYLTRVFMAEALA